MRVYEAYKTMWVGKVHLFSYFGLTMSPNQPKLHITWKKIYKLITQRIIIIRLTTVKYFSGNKQEDEAAVTFRRRWREKAAARKACECQLSSWLGFPFPSSYPQRRIIHYNPYNNQRIRVPTYSYWSLLGYKCRGCGVSKVNTVCLLVSMFGGWQFRVSSTCLYSPCHRFVLWV